MSTKITCGVAVPVKVKPEHLDDFRKFLESAPPLMKKEPDTIHWFGTTIEGDDDGPQFGLMDTFTGEEGRQAHMKGEVAAGLMSHGDWYAAPPDIRPFDILASKSGPKDYVGTKGGVEVGLRVFMRAKPDKIEAVREFLTGALPLVEAEPATTHWIAVHIPTTNVFGILDSFPDEAGRQAHLNGKVAEALFANADTLLEGPPDVKKMTIIAGNIN